MVDRMPGGGRHHKKPVSKADLARLKAGYQRADAILAREERQREVLDVPEAEAMLDAHLQQYEQKFSEDIPVTIHPDLRQEKKSTSWWQRLFTKLWKS